MSAELRLPAWLQCIYVDRKSGAVGLCAQDEQGNHVYVHGPVQQTPYLLTVLSMLSLGVTIGYFGTVAS